MTFARAVGRQTSNSELKRGGKKEEGVGGKGNTEAGSRVREGFLLLLFLNFIYS